MLEYRDFPVKTSLFFILLSPVMAYFIYIIKELAFGTLLLSLGIDHVYWLGLGAACGAMSLLFVAFTMDRVKYPEVLLLLAGLTPAIIGFIGNVMESPNGFFPGLVEAWVISVFVCLAFFITAWVLFLNKTVVVRFRGRISGIFIFATLAIVYIFTVFEMGLLGTPDLGLPMLEIGVLVFASISAAFQPWKWTKVPLAVHGNHLDYFVPTVLLLASHILWFFATVANIRIIWGANNPSYVSWSQSAGISLIEPVLLGVGALIAGFLADRKGRKTTFNASILLMGLLGIFASSFYGTTHLYAEFLVIVERLVEGFIIGIVCLLIWTELGSAKAKARRIALVWFFFLGYALLLFGVDHGIFGLGIPNGIEQFGAQISIVIALIASTMASNPQHILGQEVEMVDLSLDFDDKEVKATVDAFVGDDDFDSIRCQLDILGGSEDLSDSDFSEIVGDDFQQMLPLQRVPGIGPVLGEKLRKAGYTSAAQLAGETASRLSSKIDGLGLDRAEKLLTDARKIAKKTMKKGK
ncbi:MAG: helix-hairpin-helix domain-containing protein [Candidatus Thorarchaeota archaeon]|nr:helix-hairpin-helix domain-containing protein [Candidatus Thorarchaeota archaeon]